MDKNELVNKIRGIEGLTNDEKSALIEMLRKQKKYGLVWEDKPEDVEERLREELPMLIGRYRQSYHQYRYRCPQSYPY